MLKLEINKILLSGLILFSVYLIADSGRSQTTLKNNSTIITEFPAVEEINEDSLIAMVKFLSIKNSTGELRSRFVLRGKDLKVIADSLCSRLENYTGHHVDRFPFTFEERRFSPNDSTYTSENLVARVPGTGKIDGLFIVSAHYDAIAHRTPGWKDNWQNMPAPGADDNGTGVATVLELARVIKPNTLPFDVLFVLFSAEELGRLGSEDFVENYDSYVGENIISDITVDMVGYNGANEKGCALFSDFESGWVADLLEDVSKSELPQFEFEIFKPSLGNSDHASFWDGGYDAVCFVEPGDEYGLSYYPYYHTIQDTLGWIDFSQVKAIAQTIRDFFLSIRADTIPDYSILRSDVFLKRWGYPTSRKTFEVGDTITLDVRVRNLSSAVADPSTSIRLDIEISNQNGRKELFSSSIEPPSPLRASEILIPLVLDRSEAGENIVTVSISIDGFDFNSSNNKSSINFKVNSESGGSVVLSSSIIPNPVTCQIKDASFCVNLASKIDLMFEIFTLEGERICTSYIGSRWGKDLTPGQNCFKLSDLFPDMPELSSGIYPYRIVIYRNGVVAEKLNGRFAIVR